MHKSLIIWLLSCQSLFAQLLTTPCADLRCVLVSGLSCADSPQLEVRLMTDNKPSTGAITGRLAKANDTVLFYPRLPFRAGRTYELRFPGCLSVPHYLVVPMPVTKKEPPVVEKVYPTADELPMNLLKVYIQFSQPMHTGEVYDHIQLYRLPGRIEEPDAFVRMGEELWDESHQRLTLFLDPGRIKRGVGPNLQAGLPLRDGTAYELVIAGSLENARGVTLGKNYVKQFTAIASDRILPDLSTWVVEAPAAASLGVLTLHFPEPMDYALLNRFIKVFRGGSEVPGHVAIGERESSWSFTPSEPWMDGTYLIRVNSWLEDLAGNNLSRLFDVDLGNPDEQPGTYGELTMGFSIPPSNENNVSKK